MNLSLEIFGEFDTWLQHLSRELYTEAGDLQSQRPVNNNALALFQVAKQQIVFDPLQKFNNPKDILLVALSLP